MSAHAHNQADTHPGSGTMVPVWSPVVRITHWALVGGFAVAYLTEDDLLQVHTWAGYVAAAAVLGRLLWGIVGPQQDRLTHFLRPPGEVLAYLWDAVRLRSRRYMGHTPAGAVMGLALLLSIAATTATGMALLAETRNAGPLAPWFGSGNQIVLTVTTPAYADKGGREERSRAEGFGERGEGREGGARSAIKPVHEFFANLTLALVLAHVSGVLLACFSHRENLIASMITGRKRQEPV